MWSVSCRQGDLERCGVGGGVVLAGEEREE